MTDRLTGVEVLELLGQASDPPLSAADTARIYDNTTTGLRKSVNGGPYANLGAVVETVEYAPKPEIQRNGIQSTFVAAATLGGASFSLPRPVLFNRLIFEVTAFAAPATGVLLIYQEPRGRATDSMALVATVPVAPAVAVFEVAPTEGTVLLSDGIFYCLFGQDTGVGSFEMRTYGVNSVSLLTAATTVTGTHPFTATSALAASAPPGTIDPQIGGDLVAGAAAKLPLIIRFRNV